MAVVNDPVRTPLPIAKLTIRFCVAAISIICLSIGAAMPFASGVALTTYEVLDGLVFFTVYVLPYVLSIAVAVKLSPRPRLSFAFCVLTIVASSVRLSFTISVLIIYIDSSLHPEYEENGGTIAFIFESFVYLAQCSVCVLLFVTASILDKTLCIRSPAALPSARHR